MSDRGGGPDMPNRRPKDRKQRILAAAAAQFHTAGFDNVGMAEIAADVGITAGALYRHFRNKQDLLHAAVLDAFNQFYDLLPDPITDLDGTLEALATVTLQRRELGTLYEREIRHLPAAAQRDLREKLRAGVRSTAAAIQRTRPELSEADAELLAYAMPAILESTANHKSQLDQSRFAGILTEMCRAAYRSLAVPSPQYDSEQPLSGSRNRNRIPRASRREQLLSTAADLFHHHGFHAVTMLDIGAACGITGAAVYSHFDTKSNILVALLTRANETLQLDLSRALGSAASSLDALHDIVRSYVDMTLTNTEMVGILITEVINLPAEHRHRLRSIQHGYVEEWVRLLRSSRPTLDQTAATTTVHAALAVINNLARIPHLRGRPRLAEELAELALTVLGLREGRTANATSRSRRLANRS